MKLKILSFTPIIYLAISSFLFSCSNDDDIPNYSFGFIPASEINYNEDSIQPVNKVTKIAVTFKLKNSCQEFLEFKTLDTSSKNNITDIGIYGAQINYVNCDNPNEITLTKYYNFIPKKAGLNEIRAWIGRDTNGNHQFISKTIEIPE